MEPLTDRLRVLCFLSLHSRNQLCALHRNFFRMLNLESVKFPKLSCKYPGDKQRVADGVVLTVIFASLSKYRAQIF